MDRWIGVYDGLHWLEIDPFEEPQRIVAVDPGEPGERFRLEPGDLWPEEFDGQRMAFGNAEVVDDGLLVSVVHGAAEPRGWSETRRLLFHVRPDVVRGTYEHARITHPEAVGPEFEAILYDASRSVALVRWDAPEAERPERTPPIFTVYRSPWRSGQVVEFPKARSYRRFAVDIHHLVTSDDAGVVVLRAEGSGWREETRIAPPGPDAADASVEAIAVRENRVAMIWKEPRRVSLHERVEDSWVERHVEPLDPNIFFSGSTAPLVLGRDALFVGAQAPHSFFDHVLVVAFDGGLCRVVEDPGESDESCFARCVGVDGDHLVSWCGGDGSIDFYDHPNCPNLTVLELAR
ncbi:MAG TPA: hypothetical protein VJP77_00725 [Planctomycetota bacterium]|nr:hypothetical protein [Planctomycetota bacterium]